MSPQKRFSILLTVLVLLTSQVSFSQTDKTAKRSVATVLFASLGGAILGLSTLSFYGEPQEHTNNITWGTLLGFIGGVSYVVYDSSRPALPPPPEYSQVFGSELSSGKRMASAIQVPMLRLRFEF